DDPHGGAPVLAQRHHRWRDAGARPRDRRDDRHHARDRQRAADRRHDLLAGLHAGCGDRQRVRRGGQQRAAPRVADRRRPRAVRADAGREHDRPRHRLAAWAAQDPGRRMSADALTALPPISGRRRRTDKAARTVLLVATLIALVPLVLVIYYLLKRGLGAISWHFFSTDPTGAFIGDPGGIKSALLGTLEIVAFASVIAIPIGVGVALYLVEYGKEGRFANVVRYFVDVMTGVPSIVFGLFVYITLVIGGVVS